MHFDIRHITTYRYSLPVRLGPHVIRLVPRADGFQRPLAWRCRVVPEPVRQADLPDTAGNLVTHLWFAGTTTGLRIDCSSAVVTMPQAGPDTDAGACGLPPAYSEVELAALGTCRDGGTRSSAVTALAGCLAAQAGYRVPAFLDALNAFLHAGFERVIRDEGVPQPPELTLVTRRGACRDLAMLFIAVCRARGIAARFVSGYQARAAHPGRRRYLHAWPEAYIPGNGWRGYDPTHGSRVADAHVAVAAACEPSGAMPVDGCFYGEGVTSTLEFELSIRTRPCREGNPCYGA